MSDLTTLAAKLERWSRRDRAEDTNRGDRYVRMSKFVQVHPKDDWYPNYDGSNFGLLPGQALTDPGYPQPGRQYVHMSLHVHLGSLECRIAIWGADDHGVERDNMPLAEGIDLWCRLTRNTCPPHASLITRWGFGGA